MGNRELGVLGVRGAWLPRKTPRRGSGDRLLKEPDSGDDSSARSALLSAPQKRRHRSLDRTNAAKVSAFHQPRTGLSLCSSGPSVNRHKGKGIDNESIAMA